MFICVVVTCLIKNVTATSKLGNDSIVEPHGDVVGRCKVRSPRNVARSYIATSHAGGGQFQKSKTGATIVYFLYFWFVWLIIPHSNVNTIKIKWIKLHQVCEKEFRESQRKFFEDTYFISPIGIDQHYCTPVLLLH